MVCVTHHRQMGVVINCINSYRKREKKEQMHTQCLMQTFVFCLMKYVMPESSGINYFVSGLYQARIFKKRSLYPGSGYKYFSKVFCPTLYTPFFSYGTTAHVEPCPPLYSGFLITLERHGRSDQPVAEASTYTGQHNV
jgi:hypothetical protein